MTAWDRSPVAALLSPLSLVYGLAVRARNRWFDRPGHAIRAGVPVISVGNITVGGTGKTPFVAWLVRRLQTEGRNVAIVTRGYRGRAGRGPYWVSRGKGPMAGASECGDEAYLLARALDGVGVVAGSDRVAGAVAARESGADVVVLDDGFQHRRLFRDLDLVLLDSLDPFGNRRLLPGGRLREPIGSLARADLVVITRSQAGSRFEAIERTVRAHNPRCPILTGGHRALGFVDAEGRAVETPGRVLAFCGIGNPSSFFEDLLRCGVTVVGTRRYADHHPYTARDRARLAALASEHSATLVTTEKDMVRLPSGIPDATILALRIEMEVHDEPVLLKRVRRAISGER